jgi:hypothetical protein
MFALKNGKSWREALLDSIPQRKILMEINQKEEEGINGNVGEKETNK